MEIPAKFFPKNFCTHIISFFHSNDISRKISPAIYFIWNFQLKFFRKIFPFKWYRPWKFQQKIFSMRFPAKFFFQISMRIPAKFFLSYFFIKFYEVWKKIFYGNSIHFFYNGISIYLSNNFFNGNPIQTISSRRIRHYLSLFTFFRKNPIKNLLCFLDIAQ